MSLMPKEAGSPDSLREARLWLSEYLDVKPKDQKVGQG